MKVDEIFNDKTLCALSALLILFWAGAKYKIFARPWREGEASAATFLRISCGFLLVGASLDKLGDAGGFLGLIKECYFFIPSSLQPLTAVVIPWFEFFTGLCLIFGFRWRGAALVFCGLMAVYASSISWDVLHGIDCSCGCFNKDTGEKMSAWTILRDLLFFGTGYIVLVSRRTFLSLDDLND